ncbi:CBS domain-containing protein [Aeromicrobium camelliae]|uniref:CBS domain-containing protein n=1 Tax=Aeromicrobium camelliae TaxID=1538144 RepID=A0A3N6W4U0_9ACTN|nr:CBS domain-containing protein [Aeromicrobium camelliae]RQN02500.1 CBS domain-containing protein [Aeromicrobium camelliae]
MRVRDVLSSKGSDRVFTVSPHTTMPALLAALAEHNVGALVVSDDGVTILGIVSERDIVRKLRELPDPRAATVESIMTVDIQVCRLDDPLTDLMSTMTEYRVRHVPVVEDGALVGLVSIGDAVKYRMEQLLFERDQLEQYVQG